MATESHVGPRYRAGSALAAASGRYNAIFVKELLSADCPVASLTVLCIDDDDFQREAIKALFQIANNVPNKVRYNVTVVASAAEALSTFEPPLNLKPDLVLLDIMMDGTRGDEFLPQLRELIPPHGKIVMASALSHVKRVEGLLGLGGADGYLVKPISPDTVKVVWQYVYPPERLAHLSFADRPGTPGSGSSSPRAAPPVGSIGHDNRVHSRLRSSNPAGRLLPIRLRPEDEETQDVGACKQQ